MAPLGWLQLKHQKVRLAVAVAGIAFAVVLILMQLGFRSSLLSSSVRLLERLDYDIVLLADDTLTMAQPRSFSLRRLQQARAIDGVAEVNAVYAALGIWKNPDTHRPRSIFVMGFDPGEHVISTPGVDDNIGVVQRRDTLIFDALSRPEYGPIAERVQRGELVWTELNDRRIEVSGVYELGTSFGIDGSVLTSEDNFLRLFPERRRHSIELGLVKLGADVDADRVASHMRALVPRDTLVLTRAEFIERELAYWLATTPIGAVFTFGSIMGFVVGSIIVYQILFADVSDHLPEYATLKAMGYSNRFVSGIVIQQAVILAALGYVPGCLISIYLYGVVGEATRLPMTLEPELAISVLLLTVTMCGISGILALRKIRSVDPADIF